MQMIRTKKGTFYREKLYVDGKAVHSPRFARKTDATQWKARMETEKGKFRSTGILPKVFQKQDTVTLNDEAMAWLEIKVRLQLAKRTYEHYSTALKRHILPRFGHLKLQEIQIGYGHLPIKELHEKGHNAKGINLILGVFKRVLVDATREKRLEATPFQYLREMKETPSADVYMSSDEIKHVLEVSKGHFFHSLFLIAVNTGMRRGEIAGLCWDKVNFQTGLIEIARLRDRNGLGERTKTFKSRRFIPMNAVVRNYLEGLSETAQAELVVVDENDEAFDVNHLFRAFSKFLKMARINTHYRFHDLRHTFASHFMMNGGNIYDLQKILGHSSLEMTQRYAHLAPEHLIQASNVVSFGGQLVDRKLVLRELAPM